MRIIAGKYKNRVIPTSKKFDYRPSTAKFREAIFSILSSGEFSANSPIIGAKVLDLFAGTGALSFEALSRGAQSVLLVDNQAGHLEVAKEFAKKIGEESGVKTLLVNIMHMQHSSDKYNLVFIDPPYYNDYVNKSLHKLIQHGWLADGAIIVIEMEKQGQLGIFSELRVLKEKIYGNNKLLILRYGARI
jgi:16S rRNA (guanine966-N2)-methyltransferase